MGREIVYCWKCATRLESADFGRRKAYRYGDKVSCHECVFDLVGDLPAEEQEAILSGEPPKPPSSTRIKATTRATAAIKRTTGAVPTVKEGGTTRQTSAVPRAEGGATGRRGTGALPKASTGAVPRGEGTRALKRSTGAVPRAEPPAEEGEEVSEDPAAKKKKLILIGAGGGGFVVVLVVVLIIALSGKKKSAEPDPAENPAAVQPKPKPAVDPKLAKEAAAQKAFEDAMAFFKAEPENLGGQMKGLRAALEEARGTAYDVQVERQIEILGLKFKERIEAIRKECEPHFQGEKFKTLFDFLAEKQAVYDVPEWQDPIEKLAAGYRGIADDRYKGIVRGAKDAQEQGSSEKVKDFLGRLEKWEVAEYIEKFKKELGAPDAPDAAAKTPDASKPPGPAKPPPKPVSAEMKAYLPGWEKAMGAAFARDFEQAALEIRRAAREIEGDEVKKESAEDLKALELVKALIEETQKLLPNKGRGQRLALEYFDGPASVKEAAGRVASVSDQRFEIETDGKDGKKGPTIFVEFAALTGKSLAELAKSRKGKLDPLAAAYLNLIEGNEEAARAHGGQAGNKVPDRYWQFAPEARAKAPKSGNKEFEARAAFHAAELEWRDVKTWGAAFDKYRLLTNDYSTTAIVRRNQQLILKRSAEGKDYTFFPARLRGSLHFKLQRPGDQPTWISTDEAQGRDILENYVEAEFYALPNLTYRCWAYVGACCKETFTFYYQASEQKTRNEGKEILIDPGSLALAPVPIQLTGLKNTHELHKPKDPKVPHPKTASRWEWIPIPFPKSYAGAGAKAVRICTDQPGFSVRYILVTSTRTATPNDKETAELAKELGEEAAEAAAAAPKIPGTPDPADWLVVGPFDTGLNKPFPPETEIDLEKELQSKDKKKIKWKPVKAELRDAGGAKAAVLDFEKLFNPKENVNAYALIHVRVPSYTEAKLWLGRDDGMKVWVGGTLAFSNDAGGGVQVDKESANIKLEEGWNRILIKVRNGTGGWGLAFRIADANKKPIPGLEYNAYGDQLAAP